jgi:hypothetical protein
MFIAGDCHFHSKFLAAVCSIHREKLLLKRRALGTIAEGLGVDLSLESSMQGALQTSIQELGADG